MSTIEGTLKKAIEFYSGRTVKEIEIIPDPQVPDTFAIQCKVEKGQKRSQKEETWQFLIIRYNSKRTVQEIADMLEEVEFESWPPTSGALKFF